MSPWIDLTQPIAEDAPKMSFLPAPTIEELKHLTDTSPKISRISVCTHIGTHVDAPSHFIEGGAHIDAFPLERFIVSGVVCPVKAEPLGGIGAAQLEGVDVRPGEALFLHTGWGDDYMSSRYSAHPYLEQDLADWCVERAISFIGIDFLTPDKPPELREPAFSYPIHRTLLGHDVLIIENLCLGPVSGKRVEVFAAPLLVKGAVEAAPARVAARPVGPL